ncbi:hypothetical protein BJ508DRAFT_330596 [Ascobolus immersus RN42]|uniref:Uncharacterized protein n=1 Tax=Ascobolus immersus RN42 TaxID=1160509 RepID=A0A3N4HVE2_ASCIM|nr:hypothetical protein BJ508DRAFT_330596 [Ascobolus immersus RN42]
MPPKAAKASTLAREQAAAQAELQRVAAEQQSPPAAQQEDPEEEEPLESSQAPSTQSTIPSPSSAPPEPLVPQPAAPATASTPLHAASFTLTFAELQQLLAANRPLIGASQASAPAADPLTLELGEVTPFVPPPEVRDVLARMDGLDAREITKIWQCRFPAIDLFKLQPDILRRALQTDTDAAYLTIGANGQVIPRSQGGTLKHYSDRLKFIRYWCLYTQIIQQLFGTTHPRIQPAMITHLLALLEWDVGHEWSAVLTFHFTHHQSLIDAGLDTLLSAASWEEGNVKLSNKLLGQATIKHGRCLAPLKRTRTPVCGFYSPPGRYHSGLTTPPSQLAPANRNTQVLHAYPVAETPPPVGQLAPALSTRSAAGTTIRSAPRAPAVNAATSATSVKPTSTPPKGALSATVERLYVSYTNIPYHSGTNAPQPAGSKRPRTA